MKKIYEAPVAEMYEVEEDNMLQASIQNGTYSLEPFGDHDANTKRVDYFSDDWADF